MSLSKLLLAASDGTISKNSGMIYLRVPPELLPAGYPKIQPAHITVIYLGHISPRQFDIASERAHAIARGMPPLHGHIGGLGYFDPTLSSGGKRVAYAPVRVDGLMALNHALRDLAAPESHPFIPHVCLAYVGPGDPEPPPVTSASVCFSQLFVSRGTETVAFAFQGHHLPHPHGGRHSPPVYTGDAPLTALSRVLAHPIARMASDSPEGTSHRLLAESLCMEAGHVRSRCPLLRF